MRVWLLHIGEQLPVDGRTRPFRYGYLARALGEQGHHVLRWAPTFCHLRKRQRFPADCHVFIDSHYTIQFVYAPGYRRNTGLERLRTYRVLGRRFQELAVQSPPPDVIVAAIPSLEWADAAVEYGRAREIPVVVDVRDLWPDVFLSALPRWARPAGRFGLRPFYRRAGRACAGATALTGVSQSYLDWALKRAGRRQRTSDWVAPLGFEPEPLPHRVRGERLSKLRDLGIEPTRPVCMFAGLFERSYDLETVIEAARRLERTGRGDVQFVLCGDGTKMAALKRRAAGLRNVYLPGWIDAATLQTLATISQIGLCAYTRDALQSLPNKPFEYMAGRLAILSSLTSEMADLLRRHGCGLTYRAGDAASLAHVVGELMHYPQQLETMRDNAQQAWRKWYRSGTIYADFAERLRTLVGANARAA